ncbi:MAG: amidohydrolase [Planctomycetes bacterium]|nr:amidohydrolase [Planctomycetota bacterium]
MRIVLSNLLSAFCILTAISSAGSDESPGTTKWRESQQSALQDVARLEPQLKSVNKSIWEFAEVGLEERRSSSLLVEKLKAAGFEVQTGVAHMPTSFVASYGSGKPIIGILAEYDALPNLSQQVAPDRVAVTDGAPGHGCGHSGLGTAALGAALAVKTAMEKHQLPGTIRLYGTPAEETLIGKVYMLLDGQFKDLDACLHWHPATVNNVWVMSSKAAVSVKFSFAGTAAHASGSPSSGRSALDAIELMNIGANFMREHIKEDARIHYVITDGGGAPNVVPAKAESWYYIRANSHEDVEKYYAWVCDIAEGAAKMTRTKVKIQIDTDCHEIIGNRPLAEMLHRNLTAVGAPRFSNDENAFARKVQQSLIDEFGSKFPMAIDESIQPLSFADEPNKGSTDVGDISWHVPTCGLRVACFAADSPGHSWQNVACIGSTIGEKGTITAAKVLAVSALDLLEKPDVLNAVREDFAKRMTSKKYTSLIPKGQQAPLKIR